MKSSSGLYIIAIRHKAPAWIESGIMEYQKRLSHQLTDIAIKPSFRASGKSCQTIKEIEADRIRTVIHRERIQQIVVMDVRGKMISTEALATQIKMWRSHSFDHARVGFVIGGADGLDASLRQEAHKQWSLSCMTFPHHLARLILVEQLYRAITLIEGHPYHHA